MLDSNPDLIERVRKGDRRAFQMLLEGHYDMIHRVAYRFTGFMEDADDIAQDVCMTLADKIKSFRGESSFRTWLYRIVVNSCKDHIKKRATSRTNDVGYIELENSQRAASADTNKMVAWIYREIAQLGEPLKGTALLVLAEDLSHAEAGNVLGCAESTVSWRMHEVRKLLKAKKGA